MRKLGENSGSVNDDNIMSELATECELERGSTGNSEEKFRHIFENTNDGILTVDLKGVITSCNNVFSELTGFSKEEILGKHFSLLPTMRKRDLPRYLKMFASMVRGKTIEPFEIRWIHKDGSERAVEIRTSIIKKGKKITGFQAVAKDITERMKAIAERDRAKTIVDTVDAMVDAVLVFDINGIFTFANPRYAQMFGLETKDFLGKSIMDIPGIENQKPEEIEKFMALFEAAIKNGKAGPEDVVIVATDGREIPVSIAGGTINDVNGNPTHVIGIVRDVTDRKQMERELIKHREHLEELVKERTAELIKLNRQLQREINERKEVEDALRESEEKFRNLAEKSPNMIFINKGERVIYANEKCEEIMGYSKEELYSPDFNFIKSCPPEHRELVRKSYAAHMKGEEVEPYEYSLITKEGKRLEAILTTKLISYEGEKAILGIITDITERKKAEKALRESEEKYSLVINNSSQGILVIQDRTIKFHNPRLEEITGYSGEELASSPFLEFIHPDDRQMVAEYHSKRYKGEEVPAFYQFRYIDRHGNIQWIEVNAVVIDWENRHAILGFVSDITDRKKAEEALKESEERFRQFFENEPEYCYMISPEGKILDVNESALKGLGYEKKELIGKPLKTIYAPESLPRMDHLFEIWKKTSSLKNEEMSIITKRGEIRTVLLSAGTVKDKDGKILHSISVQRDITERNRMSEELSTSEERYRSLVEKTGVGIAITNEEGEFFYVNEALCKMIGYPENELLGKQFIDFIYPEDVKIIFEIWEKGLEDPTIEEELEFRVIHKDGHIVHLWSKPTPFWVKGELAGFNAIIVDITGRKQADAALRESEELFRNIVETAPSTLLITDTKGNTVYVSSNCEGILGYTREELQGKVKWWVHEDDTPRAREAFDRTFIEFVGCKDFEYKAIKKNGEVWYASSSWVPLKDKNGKFNGIILQTTDVTERKKAEEALKESEEGFRTLAESITDIFFAMDEDLRYTYWNKASERLTGIPAREAIGKTIFDIFPDNEGTRIAVDRYRQVLKTQKPITFISEYSLKGKRFVFEISAYPSKRGLSIFTKDITESRRIQEELLQAKKMASLGQLAAGVAHEINTPLTNISLITANIFKMTDDPEIKMKLNLLSVQRKIAANIVQSLLNFSRKTSIRFDAMNPNELISNSLSSYKNRLPESVTIIKDLQPDLPNIEADPLQLQQVFANIIDNALDAMPKGGQLSVTTARKDDAHVEMRFSDTGIGIPKKDIERVFDPFFTGKRIGEGVGLGLSICHGIVEAHNGAINVQSEEGKGSTFIITLPVG